MASMPLRSLAPQGWKAYLPADFVANPQTLHDGPLAIDIESFKSWVRSVGGKKKPTH
jgi:hypothetical protein